MAPPAKKRKHESTLEELLEKGWCYYCDREFPDLKVLIDHQRTRHFQCTVPGCHRRLMTVGGLRVHLDQVHKESLPEVPNALEKRRDINVEIFGMEGVPPQIMAQRREELERSFHNRARDYYNRTGNPLPGMANTMPQQSKKPKMESKEEMKARLAEHRAKKAAEKEAAARGAAAPTNGNVPTPTPPGNYAFGAAPPASTPPVAFPGPANTPPGGMMGNMYPPPGIHGPNITSSSPPLPYNAAPPMGYIPPGMPMTAAPHLHQASGNFGNSATGKTLPCIVGAALLTLNADRSTPTNPAIEKMIDEQQQKVLASIQAQSEPNGATNANANATATAPALATAAVPATGPATAPAKKTEKKKGQLLTDNEVSWEEKRAQNPRYQLKPKARSIQVQGGSQGATGPVDTTEELHHIS